MTRVNEARVQQLRVALSAGPEAFDECFNRVQPNFDELVALIRWVCPQLVGCLPGKGKS